MTVAAATLAFASGACQPANQPMNETAGTTTSAAAPAATATVASSPATSAAPAPAPAAPAAQPAPRSEEIAMAQTTPLPGTTAEGAVPTDPSEVRRSTIEEVDALRESHTGVIVDVRDDASYNMGHITGALHIPYAELAQRIAELPRDKPIVTYCA
ncbi:MAG TPA: rhodanese-like domain-containing protein [Thermoanaerobaculia bacterium]|nr:rhodanese-like domain-containing protein [Thermoanaerobaculia bacterium]